MLKDLVRVCVSVCVCFKFSSLQTQRSDLSCCLLRQKSDLSSVQYNAKQPVCCKISGRAISCWLHLLLLLLLLLLFLVVVVVVACLLSLFSLTLWGLQQPPLSA